MRHQGPHIYSSVSTHVIDVDKVSIMTQNCCVPGYTKKVGCRRRRKNISSQSFAAV